ncbi:prephenate dehydrogenase/arogenate dehydrogenase family protein [Egicoccus sp. AB-alg6-2]|uniref:prephenate dehydrogenase/arogenate dehydrogenase family protein n=1 Tax=Egicoccus sp. AB-alg6-2 TaxID=3242692 RepID=UPI00359DF046
MSARGSSDGPATPRRVAVVGGGLVGGSVALACRAAGVDEVVLTDASAGVRERAAARGLADRVEHDVAATVHGAEVVFVAVPAAAVAAVVEKVAEHAAPDAVITDVASLKYDLTVDVESRLTASSRGPDRFVGGHPMAGSERSGPEAADATLFQGATWVLTPTAGTAPRTLQAVSALLRRFGARVLALGPARHDELVALVSHLPQLAASTLADVAGQVAEEAGEVVLALAGGGFRDTTRVAASDAALWRGILAGNRVAVLAALDRYQDRLAQVREALEAHDDDGLETVLERASLARRRLVPKAVHDAVVDLVVALDDRPGTLAVATTALGEAGINVEDLAMRHAVDGGRGALLVRVSATERDRALAALVGQGLAAHVEAS